MLLQYFFFFFIGHLKSKLSCFFTAATLRRHGAARAEASARGGLLNLSIEEFES